MSRTSTVNTVPVTVPSADKTAPTEVPGLSRTYQQDQNSSRNLLPSTCWTQPMCMNSSGCCINTCFHLWRKSRQTHAKVITWQIIHRETNRDLLDIIGSPELLHSQVEKKILALLWAREAGQKVCLPRPSSNKKYF